MSQANRLRRAKNRAAKIHGVGRPASFSDHEPLELRELPPRDEDQAIYLNAANSYLRRYRLGECSVLVTKEFGKWHLSISHRTRDPTWREISEARYRILPSEIVAAMLLPPPDLYINIDSHCFQVLEIDDPETRPTS